MKTGFLLVKTFFLSGGNPIYISLNRKEKVLNRNKEFTRETAFRLGLIQVLRS